MSAAAACVMLLLVSCNNPADIETKRIHSTSFVETGLDDPRFDTLTAVVSSKIRFEAVVDTERVRLQRFAGSGLRLALAAFPPETVPGLPGVDSLTELRDVYSLPADYLDIPAVALPLRMSLPPSLFRRFAGARLAVAVVLLYRDLDGDGRFGRGDEVHGASEQHLFAWAEGRLSAVPVERYGDVRAGPNKLVRIGPAREPDFRATPDYTSTIFIVYVRGAHVSYDIPLSWSTRPVSQLTP